MGFKLLPVARLAYHFPQTLVPQESALRSLNYGLLSSSLPQDFHVDWLLDHFQLVVQPEWSSSEMAAALIVSIRQLRRETNIEGSTFLKGAVRAYTDYLQRQLTHEEEQYIDLHVSIVTTFANYKQVNSYLDAGVVKFRVGSRDGLSLVYDKNKYTSVSFLLSDIYKVLPDVMFQFSGLSNLDIFNSIASVVKIKRPQGCILGRSVMEEIKNKRELVDLYREKMGLSSAAYPHSENKKIYLDFADRQKIQEQKELNKLRENLKNLRINNAKLKACVDFLESDTPLLKLRLKAIQEANEALHELSDDLQSGGCEVREDELTELSFSKREKKAVSYPVECEDLGILTLEVLRKQLGEEKSKNATFFDKKKSAEKIYHDLKNQEDKLIIKNKKIFDFIYHSLQQKAAPIVSLAEASQELVVPCAPSPEKDNLDFGAPFMNEEGVLSVHWKLAGLVVTVPLPKDFKDIEAWVEQHLGEHVILPRAVGKKLVQSPYRDKARAYMALLLAATYAETLNVSEEDRSSVQAFFLEMTRKAHLRGAPPASHNTKNSHKLRDIYAIWHDNQKVVADIAFKAGVAHGEENCFRLYLGVIGGSDKTSGAPSCTEKKVVICSGFAHLKISYE